MRTALRSRLVGLAALALAALGPRGAPAAPKQDPKAQARALANQGYELSQKGDYQGAADAYEKAEHLFHAPTLLLELGHAKLQLGKLLDARVVFQSVADEKLPRGAPAEFGAAQVTARTSLAELDARIPTLSISVTGAQGKSFTVALDQAPVARAALEHPIPLDPGSHTVDVQGDDATSRTVKLAEKDRQVLAIPFPMKAPVAVAVTPPPPPPRRDLRAPAAIALVLGAGGIGVGAVLGIGALQRADSVKALCPGNICPPLATSQVTSARTSAAISTYSLIIGGVVGATGLTLLILNNTKTPPQVGLVLGPGSLIAQGVF